MKTISESELEVMKCLWDEEYITLKEIVNKIENDQWSYSTIRTMVQRLMKKNFISADKTTPNNFKYYPLIKELDYKEKESKKLLNNVFDGSFSMLVSALSNKENLSDKSIQEIEDIINNLKNDGK